MSQRCDECKHFDDKGVFELCKHSTSQYQDNNARVQFHTVAHMKLSQCHGEKLFDRSYGIK